MRQQFTNGAETPLRPCLLTTEYVSVGASLNRCSTSSMAKAWLGWGTNVHPGSAVRQGSLRFSWRAPASPFAALGLGSLPCVKTLGNPLGCSPNTNPLNRRLHLVAVPAPFETLGPRPDRTLCTTKTSKYNLPRSIPSQFPPRFSQLAPTPPFRPPGHDATFLPCQSRFSSPCSFCLPPLSEPQCSSPSSTAEQIGVLRRRLADARGERSR